MCGNDLGVRRRIEQILNEVSFMIFVTLSHGGEIKPEIYDFIQLLQNSNCDLIKEFYLGDIYATFVKNVAKLIITQLKEKTPNLPPEVKDDLIFELNRGCFSFTAISILYRNHDYTCLNIQKKLKENNPSLVDLFKEINEQNLSMEKKLTTLKNSLDGTITQLDVPQFNEEVTESISLTKKNIIEQMNSIYEIKKNIKSSIDILKTFTDKLDVGFRLSAEFEKSGSNIEKEIKSNIETLSKIENKLSK